MQNDVMRSSTRSISAEALAQIEWLYPNPDNPEMIYVRHSTCVRPTNATNLQPAAVSIPYRHKGAQ